MKVVRVHNPNGLLATKRKVKTMAKRKAATGRRKTRKRTTAANPRKRRSSTRARRRNPGIVRRRRHSRATANPRRRHSRRRRNPSAMHVGQVLKNVLYGTAGAIATRVASGLAMGFIPGALSSNQLAEPVTQAVIAVTVVRWAGKKFLGQAQGDTMALGGLISAGLNAADKFLPNIQGQLSGIIRAPVQIAPGAAIPMVGAGAPAAALAGYAGYADVEDVPGFAGYADVEDIETGAFNNY